jgi:5-methyltetrahydropteroyltriglutamate--homocysteine methyltransferase
MGVQRGGGGGQFDVDFFVELFNNTVRGLRDLTEVWCHTCWGNPAQQRLFATDQSYKPSLPHLNRLNVDVITFECCTTGGADLEHIAKAITNKKIAIGVVNHRDLQVERPEQVANLVEKALEYIPVERLVLSSDCGFGREGMSRRIAFYKMVSIVRGANIVRKKMGLPEAPSFASDSRFALAGEF